MGYFLQAFITKSDNALVLTSQFNQAKKVELDQGLCLILMTKDLYNQMNNLAISPAIEHFEYLTENVERQLLACVGRIHIAYIEAEYHGGQGGQQALIWKESQRQCYLPFGSDRINQLLRDFGVVTTNNYDEFGTLRLGWHRDTEGWLEEVV